MNAQQTNSCDAVTIFVQTVNQDGGKLLRLYTEPRIAQDGLVSVTIFVQTTSYGGAKLLCPYLYIESP